MESRRRYVNPGLSAQPMTPEPQARAQNPLVPETVPGPTQTVRQVTYPWAIPEFLDQSPACQNSTPLPPYFRATVAAFPVSPAVEAASGAPLALIINPTQVVDIPTIDYSQAARLSRCVRCAAYLSPYSKIVGDGRSWQCPFCSQVNQVDGGGLGQRVELSVPVYDMIAPPAFRVNQERGPCFMFLFDLSKGAVESAFTANCINSILASIDSLGDSVKVGIMTMGSSVSVYDFGREREFVVGDLSDPCVTSKAPVELGMCREKFKSVLNSLVTKAGEVANVGQCYGSALMVAEKAMSGYGGVLVACCAGYPTLGPHSVSPRSLNTSIPEEKLLRLPEDGSGKYYREIGFMLNRAGVSVHLFNIPSQDTRVSELSVIAIPSNLTGGIVHHYTEFDPMRLHTDLFETLTAAHLWDSSTRLRYTAGISTKAVFGNLTSRDKTMCFPVLNPNNSIGYELTVEQELKTPRVLFQCAVLWTNADLKRLIRIFTFELPTTNQPQVVRQYVDEAAMAVYFMKKSVSLTLAHGPISAAATIRKMFSTLVKGQTYQCIYYFVYALLRSPLLRHDRPSGSVDIRYATLVRARAMSFFDSILFMYPRMIVVDSSPTPVPLSTQSFANGNIIVVHTYDRILLWISPDTHPEKLYHYTGCTCTSELTSEVPTLSTPENEQLHDTLNKCHTLSRRYLPVEIITPGSPRESVFNSIILDMGPEGPTIHEFLVEFTGQLLW